LGFQYIDGKPYTLDSLDHVYIHQFNFI